MPWEVVLPVLLAAALHAAWNALVKSGADRLLDMVLVVTGAGAVTAVAAAFLPQPARACWPHLGASVLIHVGYFGLVGLAYRQGDLSLVYPIMRGSAPALTAFAGVALLSERPSWGGWTGIVLISGGVLLLVLDAQGREASRATTIGIALTNAAVVVLYTMIDGTGARLSGHPFSYTAWMLLFTSGLSLFLALLVGKRKTAVHLARRWRIGLAGGGCTFASYAMALWAMTHAPIALVVALRETSILFGTLFAAVALKEQITPLRYVSIASIAAGAISLKVG
jgi:drug/metabolite transporter (DMT)-like permease